MPDYPFNYNSPTVVNQKRIEIMKRQQKEKENLKYKPSDSVMKTKKALASLSMVPYAAVPASLAGSVYDFGTASKYYLDNQKEKAVEDFIQGIISILPTKKAGFKQGTFDKLKSIMGLKIASDIETITQPVK